MTMADASGRITYDTWRARWCFLRDSYLGDQWYRLPSKTSLSTQRIRVRTINDTDQSIQDNVRSYVTYLCPHPGESDEAFALRLSLAAYVNLVQPVVKAYAEAVTGSVTRNVESLADLLEDVGGGRSWADLVDSTARWSCVYGGSFVVFDAPANADAMSAADDPRPYAMLVHPTQVAWVRCDAWGTLEEFAWVEELSQVPTVGGPQRCRIRVWDETGWRIEVGEYQADTPMGRPVYSTEIARGPDGAELRGPLPAGLDEIPVEFVPYERDETTPAPLGVSLIGDAADIARLIYNKLSWESEIERKAGFPTLTVPAGKTGGQLDPEAKIALGPDKAIAYASDNGKPEWIQPAAEWPKALRESVGFHAALAMRMCGIDVTSGDGNTQSGEALKVRSRDFEARAMRFAKAMRRFELRGLKILATLAGQPNAKIEVTYPKRFVLQDPDGDLRRALTLLSPSQMPVEIGMEAKVAAVRSALEAVFAPSDEAMRTYLDEVRSFLSADVADVNEARQVASADRQARIRDAQPAPDAQAPQIEAPPQNANAATNVQQTALNGAQVSALLEIMGQCARGELPRDASVNALVMAFQITAPEADRILGSIGKGFVPTVQADVTSPPAAPPPTQSNGNGSAAA